MEKDTALKKTGYLNRLEMLKEAKHIVAWICFFALFTIIISYFLYNVFAYYNSCEIYTIQNFSMYPTINENRLVNDKAIVDERLEAKIGDVIMFSAMIDGSVTNITKRLIATEGDKITVVREFSEDGTYYYLSRIPSGHTTPYKMIEEYVANQNSLQKTYEKFQTLYTKSDIQTEVTNGQIYIIIPDDNIFFLGDNRASSYDCSNMGPCNISGYRGRVVYLVKEGKNIEIVQALYALGLVSKNI